MKNVKELLTQNGMDSIASVYQDSSFKEIDVCAEDLI